MEVNRLSYSTKKIPSIILLTLVVKEATFNLPLTAIRPKNFPNSHIPDSIQDDRKEAHIIVNLANQYWAQLQTRLSPNSKRMGSGSPEELTAPGFFLLMPQFQSGGYVLTNLLCTCLIQSQAQNTVIQYTVLVIRGQMIEHYRKGKKESGNIKSLWKKTKQQQENDLFQKPQSVFWWYSDKFEPIKSAGSSAHCRERRMWAATSNHTQDYPLTSHPHLLRGVTHSTQMHKENEKPFMQEIIHRSSVREFLFSFENPASVPQCSKTPTELPNHMRKC